MWGSLKSWGIKKAVISEEVENAMKERVSVKVDGMEMWGWIVPAK